jgi:type IV secretory pathway VirB2 component (pilin)
MKSLLFRASLATAAVTAFATKAFAALPLPPTVSGLDNTGSDTTTIQQSIVRVIEYVLNFVLIIAIVYVVIAGFRLILSGGDEGEKDKAKTTIIYVAVGILIVLFARVIVLFVNNLVS